MGDLTKSEFIDMMVPMLSNLEELKESNYSANDIADAIYKSATKNSNTGKITRQQFDAMDETQIGLIVGFFITDKDKSGFVDKAELKAYLTKYDTDQELTENDYKELFEAIEEKGEVKLSMDEFINLIIEL